ncbi:type II toxin-antitoxin system RelE family toxin [Dyadobacter fanqingshengii]|uniref:Type II toxin-antitoxin system RelE/ParE family toxin n=1 Tax=Dyadobacter fanqingshengii TaxID=2906443 RepID=A0A9X1PFP5_9BACT|nr:type II toxin-antitoxin system RelE/ParE family toxin [Dyadobacter fanqingshengii]MCF0043697.1 type II toxin-antitoxin system RelE/ParE family toxin [Dyadobacter fanqingshengii]MCF2507106.1 type II toxin-antitoxin system RelE/ParE family toxin [Dyadobacter fanqingshengii]USJ34931.1 type II toxin-antitoxin system RelE/ParE family toxin [Dyadobacter fanqingshengii]
MYKVIIKKSAIRELENITKVFRLKIIQKIDDLASDPRPQGIRKLENSLNSYRIRVGSYRVIYTIEDQNLLVEVIKVADRKDAYRSK